MIRGLQNDADHNCGSRILYSFHFGDQISANQQLLEEWIDEHEHNKKHTGISENDRGISPYRRSMTGRSKPDHYDNRVHHVIRHKSCNEKQHRMADVAHAGIDLKTDRAKIPLLAFQN